ncbi:MAG: pyridoxal phosphate-dependent aminotransferase [Anaerolineae bacterium]|nr:pyridoxal phosphate-dependent aminotransferase [Anaerolineae bacterium]
MRLSSSVRRLRSESALDVLSRARAIEAQGRTVIHMEIGEPDFDTPSHIVEAAIEALHRGETHYTPAAGILPLREAIAAHVERTRGIRVPPDRIVVTLGAKPVVFFAMLALLEPGDECVYPDPGFPIYESMILFTGARPIPAPLHMENDFRFDVDELSGLVSEKTKLLVLNSPENPTGGVLTPADLERIADLAQRYDFYVLSDEIYSQILYEGEHHSIAALPDMDERTIILDGFSKTYAMTGWRLGYGVFPTELAPYIVRLQVNSNSCAAAFTQWAGLAALTGPQEPVARMVAEFRRRRELIVNGLNRIPGIRCLRPQGAFYVFPNIEGTGLSSEALANKLLEEGGVATLAGSSFGSCGEGFLRLSYATSTENIQEGLERMSEVIGRITSA